MFINKEKAKIKGFDLNHPKAYKIRYEGSARGLSVFRSDGAVMFGKGGILPESVDKFEMCCDGQKTRIYLYVTTEKHGSYSRYVGETEDHLAAIKWVSQVNNFYLTKIHPKYTKERTRRSASINWAPMPITDSVSLSPVMTT